MKKTLFIVPMVIAFLVMASSPNATGEGQGIKFHEGTWAEAVQKAKKEKKAIFLDISASWCGPCKMLKRNSFPNGEVGAYFNKQFVNVEVDGEVGEGIMLAQKFQIRGYPTLVFLDKSEKVLLQTAGYRPPDALVELGKQATGIR
jgi:thioredoxin-related protein